MKGDFTRGHSPDRKRGESYRRVLLQQGRALLDSDIAALVDAQDNSLREAVHMVACKAGSSDLGLLVSPGRLLAQFDGTHGNDFLTTGSAAAERDYSRRYLDRLPGLRIGGPDGMVVISLNETLPAGTDIVIWTRADNGGATSTLNGQPFSSPGVVDYQPVSATVSGNTLGFATDPGARFWVAFVETRQNAGPQAAFHWQGDNYEVEGLTFPVAPALWPDLADPAGAAMQAASADAIGTRYLAYAEITERHITAIEDPGILEEALGGDVDTTTRTQVSCQVKLAQITGPMSVGEVEQVMEILLLPGGQVTFGTALAAGAADPCDLPVPGGYTGPENRLYRLEVHSVTPGGALFKWSRDNGADLFAAAFPAALAPGAPASQLAVRAEADLADGDLVELLSDAIELGDETPATLTGAGLIPARPAQGRLLRLAGGAEVSGNQRLFDLLDPITEAPVANVDSARFGTDRLKLRRWSGLISHTADGDHELEHGITATVTGSFGVNDYWLYEARNRADNANGPGSPDPHGPERLFAPLAILRQTPAAQPMVLEAWLDSRFPRLCEIEAADVSYDGARVGSDSDSVQEALDELFEAESTAGCGEIALPPGGDIRDIIDAIPAGESAKICLGPGDRNVSGTVQVFNKGHITITGIGLGSLLNADRPLFEFRNCRAVTLVDFSVSVTDPGRHVIWFDSCNEVSMRNISIRATAEASHGNAAIRVTADDRGRPCRKAVIERCQLLLGLDDTGILMLDVEDAQVLDCDISVQQQRFDVQKALTNNAYASRFGRVFLSQLSFSVDSENFVGGSEVRFNMGEKNRHGIAMAGWGRDSLRFSTHRRLDPDFWADIADANPSQQTGSTISTQVRRAHMRALIRWTRRGLARFSAGLSAGGTVIPTSRRSMIQNIGQRIIRSASQVSGEAGIVIADRGNQLAVLGTDPARLIFNAGLSSARVNRNRITGFHQGIRIGSSSSGTGARQNRNSVMNDVEIDSNHIELLVPAYARSRWGIFAGNAISLAIRNNRVADQTPQILGDTTFGPATDGIRAWGVFGPFVQIERNFNYNTSDGVRFRPVLPNITPDPDPSLTRVWKVSDPGIDGDSTPTNAYFGPGQPEITPSIQDEDN